MERCPCCNARLSGASVCPRCQSDLSAVAHSAALGRFWLDNAVRFWLCAEPRMASLALAKSLQFKQTDVALAFRAFIVDRQCRAVFELLRRDKFSAAAELLTDLRNLHPHNTFIAFMLEFVRHLDA
jgi:hypothetical protein